MKWGVNLPVKIACRAVKSVVATRHSIWIEHHDHLVHIVLPKASALFTLETKRRGKH